MRITQKITFQTRFLVFLSCCFFLLLFSSCEVERVVPIDFRRASIGLDYQVHQMPCTNGGTTFWIDMDDMQNYAISWEADQQHWGHDRQVHCYCGQEVKVHVMRLQDGETKTKKMAVPECGTIAR